MLIKRSSDHHASNLTAFLGGGHLHDCGLFPREGVVQVFIVCGDGRGCVVSGFHALVFSQSGGQPFPCLPHVVGVAVMTGYVINSLTSVKSVYFIFQFW